MLGEEDDESSEPERDPKRGAGRRSGTPSEKRPTSGEKTPVDTDAEQRYLKDLILSIIFENLNIYRYRSHFSIRYIL